MKKEWNTKISYYENPSQTKETLARLGGTQ